MSGEPCALCRSMVGRAYFFRLLGTGMTRAFCRSHTPAFDLDPRVPRSEDRTGSWVRITEGEYVVAKVIEG